MNRVLMLLALGVVLAAVASSKAQPAPPPNIVVFLTDDHSQRDLAPYGGKEFATPNMQKLAEEGMLFKNAYVASPTCAPSRAALLTGLMPARNGAEPNHSRPRKDLKKWPAYFQELGYEVVAFGKVAHYKHTADYGFDHFAHDTFHDYAGIPAAVKFLKNRDRSETRPLCILVGSNWPHVPWPEDSSGYRPERLSLPAKSVDTPATRRWRARYAAAVSKADHDLGIIYQAAREELHGNTIFLFSSDHGAQWPFAKWNLYEAGIRVPLIVVWPGVVKPRTHTEAMVSWVDILPTLIEAAGGKSPGGVDGLSFLQVIQGQTHKHRPEIFATHSGDGRWNVYPMRSIRSGQWKYIRNLHPEYAFTTHIDLPGNLGQRAYWSTWETAAQENSKAAEIVKSYHQRPKEELYDLVADPDEKTNLAADPQHATRLKELRHQLERWIDSQGDTQRVFGPPRLLGDPNSHGPKAVSGDAPPPRKSEAQGAGQ